MSGRWVDLREAAELLGTSTEAVRKRATRGSLRSDRHDGRVVVWVDESRTEGGHEAQVDHEALIEAKDHAIRILEDQLREEREARRRADMIIAQLTQANAALAAKVPELEAAPAQPASSQSREEQLGEPTGATPRPRAPIVQEAQNSSEGTREPWYKRWFGG
jgi:hypothetical protein